MNLVKNVAGVSASDDDLQIFGGSTGNAASILAVTLSVCFKVAQTSDIINSHTDLTDYTDIFPRIFLTKP